MKIAYVTHFDAQNVLAWSGSGYTIGKSLKDAGCEIEYIGPLKRQYNPINIAQYLINTKILHKGDHPQRHPGFLRYYGTQVERMLAGSTADAIVSPGGLPLTYVRTSIPMVMWTDCTFANVLQYYPAFSNLSARTIRNGHDAEQRALDNCSLLLFAAQWAADSAIHDYNIDPSKVHVVPLGSNLPDANGPADIERMIAAKVKTMGEKLTLFCSGVDWYRKGIDVAVKVAGRLNAMGINTELLVARMRAAGGGRSCRSTCACLALSRRATRTAWRGCSSFMRTRTGSSCRRGRIALALFTARRRRAACPVWLRERAACRRR